MSSTSFQNPARVAAVAGAVLAAGFASYAVYFDYKRRNDPVFRKKLLKEHKRLSKTGQQQRETGRQEIVVLLKRALVLINSEPVPATVDAKEQYFMEQVGLGEQLAARGSADFFVAAAISFYKALKVYPAPTELIMIYQKTQPPQVFELVMELIQLDVEQSQRAPSSDPRDNSAGAILTEIEPEAPPAPLSENGSSPSTGSYVHVEEDKEEEEVEEIVEVVVAEVVAEVAEVVAEVEEALEKGDDPPEPTLAA